MNAEQHDDDDLLTMIDEALGEGSATAMLRRLAEAGALPIDLEDWQGDLLERALGGAVPVHLERGRGRLVLDDPGLTRDEFGTWYWPASAVAERDAVAATVAGWDLAALGVTP